MAEQATVIAPARPAGAAAGGVAPSAAVAVAGSPAVEAKPLAQPAQPDKGGWIWGTGRRKTAVARVRVKPGSGKFLINQREAEAYFSELRDRNAINAPLKATNTLGRLDVAVNVHGGGYTGQAGAIVLGLARALKGYDPALEPALRDNGMLTRDARKVERKKYGQPGARRGFQWAKR